MIEHAQVQPIQGRDQGREQTIASVPLSSPTNGSIGHIVGEMFKQQQGLNMEHVPYRGSGPMHSDLLGGTLQFAVDTLTQNVPYMKDKRLNGLAVTSRARSSAVTPRLRLRRGFGGTSSASVSWRF